MIFGVPIASIAGAYFLLRSPVVPGRLSVDEAVDVPQWIRTSWAVRYLGGCRPRNDVSVLYAGAQYLPFPVRSAVASRRNLDPLVAVCPGIDRERHSEGGRHLWLTGLGLFTVVGFKVFFSDLASLDQFYRIVAFILLGSSSLGGVSCISGPGRLSPASWPRRTREPRLTKQLMLILLLSALSVSTVAAGDDPRFQFQKAIELGQPTGEDIVAVPLDSDVYAGTRDGYPDLRIVDRGTIVPYLLEPIGKKRIDPGRANPAAVNSSRCTWTRAGGSRS